jgi:hypothetical protein
MKKKGLDTNWSDVTNELFLSPKARVEIFREPLVGNEGVRRFFFKFFLAHVGIREREVRSLRVEGIRNWHRIKKIGIGVNVVWVWLLVKG